MAVEGQGVVPAVCYASHGLGVAEDVAVHKQELAPPHHLPRHPQRVDVVVVLVVGIVEKPEREPLSTQHVLAVDVGTDILRQMLAQHCGTVARHDDEFADAGSTHGIHGAMQQCAASHVEEAFGFVVCEWPQAACAAGGQDYSNHYALRFGYYNCVGPSA